MGNSESYRSRALNYHNPEWDRRGGPEFHRPSRDKPFFLYCNHTLHHIPHPQESLFNAIREPHGRIPRPRARCDALPQGNVEMVKREGFPEKTAFCTWLDMALAR